MSDAKLCPVCKGTGKYMEKRCHGCFGKGWVTVGTDYPPACPRPCPAPQTPYWEPWRPSLPSPYPSPFINGWDLMC